MEYQTHIPSTTPMTGVIMRFGSGELADTIVYPGRKLTQVHPSRRDEAMSYRVVSDGRGLHRTTPEGESWEHYRYTFQYRYMGRTIQVSWKCGTLYGTPKAIDGIQAAFSDARNAADFDGDVRAFADEFGLAMDEPDEYQSVLRSFDACTRMHERLTNFFNDDADERQRWEDSTKER